MPRLIRKVLAEAGADAEPDAVIGGLDVIGDVAVLRLEGIKPAAKRRVGRALLSELPYVKAVFEQKGAIEGELRLRTLRHLAGERRTLTTHRENGCAFKVDVARCYFSPRLATERLRIAEAASRDEKVLNMFAGVGPFTIQVAKRAGAKVTSWELNPYACELHRENDALNKVSGLVNVVEGDAHELGARTRRRFDRVLMPHPSMSDRFLPEALKLSRPGATVHYYRHLAGRDEAEAAAALAAELDAALPEKCEYKVRRVREVGPRWLEMAADVLVT